MKQKIKMQLREWGKAILLAFCIAWFIRFFVIQGFFIPSNSMEQTLLTGDYIFISKMHYGARLPITPFSFPFVHQRLPFSRSRSSYIDWISLPYLRLPGFASVQRQDIVVFNYPLEYERPVDRRSYFVKRCMGLPGDTILVAGKKVWAGGALQNWPQMAQKMHYIKTEQAIPHHLLDSLHIHQGGAISNVNDYNFPLTDSMAAFLKKRTQAHAIMSVFSPNDVWQEYIYPHHKKFPFNSDYFGPVWIPAKGAKLSLNDSIIWLYKDLIELHEKHKVDVVGNSIYIDGNLQTEYTFEMNYYFMLGDNRDFSSDSRTWGLVPENHIVGKAWFIFFSVDDQNQNGLSLRWTRLFNWIK